MEYPDIPEPFQFNPLKHHLGFIRSFTCDAQKDTARALLYIKMTGSSVMDVYTGTMGIRQIMDEIRQFLSEKNLLVPEIFAVWAGKSFSDFRNFTASDGSVWILKYHDALSRYVHIFPSRSSPHTFRVKANTLRSALLYLILTGKDYITEEDLNKARNAGGLSPVKGISEAEAISHLIELIRFHS